MREWKVHEEKAFHRTTLKCSSNKRSIACLGFFFFLISFSLSSGVCSLNKRDWFSEGKPRVCSFTFIYHLWLTGESCVYLNIDAVSLNRSKSSYTKKFSKSRILHTFLVISQTFSSCSKCFLLSNFLVSFEELSV